MDKILLFMIILNIGITITLMVTKPETATYRVSGLCGWLVALIVFIQKENK